MRSRLPLIISITALVVAVLGATPLGQAAYDAVLPVNSVGALQLRGGAVTEPKIRGDAVTSGKVKNRSLKAIDFAEGQIPAGPAGEKGDKGDKGDPGPAALVTTLTEGAATTLKAHSCYGLFLDGAGAVTAAGNVLTAWISDSAGKAVVPNFVNVIPGARNLTTQGGTVGGALLCNLQPGDVPLPAGWVSHYKEITLP